MKQICYAVLFFLTFLSSDILAQNFVTLNWGIGSTYTMRPDSVEHPFNFEGAFYPDNTILPYYTTLFELENNYPDYEYDVVLEYPEYERISLWQRNAVRDMNIVLPHDAYIHKSITEASGKAYLSVRFVPVVFRNGDYFIIKSFRLKLKKTALKVPYKAPANGKSVNYAENSVLSSGRWVKIAVQDRGVYSLTFSKLVSMGFTDPSKVAVYGYGGNLLQEDFTKYYCDDLPEVPLVRTSNALLFYAEGNLRLESSRISLRFTGNDGNETVSSFDYWQPVKNYSSDYGYYFITEKENPLSFEISDVANGDNAVNSFDEYAYVKSDERYAWGNYGNRLYDSNDFKYGNSRNYNIPLPGKISGEPIIVQVAFAAGLSSVSNNLNLIVDGELFAKSANMSTGSSAQHVNAKRSVTSALYQNHAGNTFNLTLEHQNSGSVSGRLDYILLNYKRKLEMTSSSLVFYNWNAEGNTTYRISNAKSSTIVLDVTYPGKYRQMKVSYDGDDAVFSDNVSGFRKYVALNTSAGHSEGYTVVGDVANQNLHKLRNVDMVIIVPANNNFHAQAERLAEEHRKRDGLNVVTVNAGHVYNEFSSGSSDPTAYRRLMKMLYDTADGGKKPKYLLLFGDCSYDNRLRTAEWAGFSKDNMLLCYMPDESESETFTFLTDDYFGFLDDNEGSDISSGRNVIDIGVGRLPVTSEAEAAAVVDKFIRYMDNEDKGDWKNFVCVVADDNVYAGGTIHMTQGDEIASYIESLHAGYIVDRLFLDLYKRESSATGYSFPVVNNRLKEYFDEGMFSIVYIGHSNPDYWSSKKVLTSNDIAKLKSDRLPLWITASCEFTRMDAVTKSSGELAVLSGQGGAIGMFSATRVVFISDNHKINKIYNKYLYGRNENGEHYTLGEVFMKTKQECSMTSPNRNDLNFVFLGDPALKLTYPDNNKLVIDSINGLAVSEVPEINAGTMSEVVGHVVDGKGNLLTDFTGKMDITVMDCKQLRTSLNNANIYYDGVPDTVQFYARVNNLYLGMDSVVNGEFRFNFPVPLDMSYSNESGLINLYASSEGKEANAGFENFIVGSVSGELDNDGTGPEISAFLNTAGDYKVNKSPMLYVSLFDLNGINISGAGVGHDIVAEIDNDPNYIFKLNDYYVPSSIYSGEIAYKLKDLPAGQHKMIVRAWDILNNSSSVELNFEVVEDIEPEMLEVSCITPAREQTTFFITHDRPNSDVRIRLEIFDYSGAAVMCREFDDVSDSTVYTYTWDLCSDTGAPLDSGIYMYRISMSTDGGRYASKTRKMSVIRQ